MAFHRMGFPKPITERGELEFAASAQRALLLDPGSGRRELLPAIEPLGSAWHQAERKTAKVRLQVAD